MCIYTHKNWLYYQISNYNKHTETNIMPYQCKTPCFSWGVWDSPYICLGWIYIGINMDNVLGCLGFHWKNKTYINGHHKQYIVSIIFNYMFHFRLPGKRRYKNKYNSVGAMKVYVLNMSKDISWKSKNEAPS